MFTTKKLVYTATLCALCAIANIFSIQISGSNYISFVYLVCFIAAIYLDPVCAAIVGGTGDLLGCLISPKGEFNPIIFVSSVLLALIPSLIFRIKKLNKNVALVISIVLCLLIVTAGLNTFALWRLYSKGRTFFVYLGVRFPFQCINALVNGVLIATLLNTKILERIFRQSQGGQDEEIALIEEGQDVLQIASCDQMVIQDQDHIQVDGQDEEIALIEEGQDVLQIASCDQMVIQDQDHIQVDGQEEVTGQEDEENDGRDKRTE